MYKYLFRGINHGIVKNVGCLESILDWIRPRLRAYGCVGFISSIFGLLTWIFGIALLCGCGSLEGKSIPQDIQKTEEENVEIKQQTEMIKIEKKK